MPQSPIPGFATIKSASAIFKRSKRQLKRDLADAMLAADEDVLKHFKLLTQDGLMREGPEITNELIKKLRTDGKNPTWYVRLSWLQKRTIPRRPEFQESEDAEPEGIAAPKSANESGGEEPQSAANSEIVILLKEQISDLKEDKTALRGQLSMFKEMFDTLEKEHADTKNLLKTIVERLPLPDPKDSARGTESSPSKESQMIEATPQEIPEVIIVESGDATSAEKGNRIHPKSSSNGEEASQKAEPTGPKTLAPIAEAISTNTGDAEEGTHTHSGSRNKDQNR